MLSITIMVLRVLALYSAFQTHPSPAAHGAPRPAFSNRELGFSFTPPASLRDLTAQAREAESKQPTDLRVRFSTLLFMTSGSDNSAGDRVSLLIETFPRGRDKDNSDDVVAGFITNYAAVGGETIDRQVVRFSGQTFAMEVTLLQGITGLSPRGNWELPTS
jgi:hypothetical protein